MEEDHAAVLRAVVRPLPVELRGIVYLEELREQLLVSNFCGIKFDVHDLGMAGAVGTHVLVGGVLKRSAHVADAGCNHAGQFGKRRFYTPETTCAKSSLFHAFILLARNKMAVWG